MSLVLSRKYPYDTLFNIAELNYMLFGVIVEISLRVLAFSESALQWKMKTLLTFYLFLVSNIDVLTSLQLSQNSRFGMF